MDGLLQLENYYIKVEHEETVENEEFQNEYVEIELPNEFIVKQEHLIENNESELTDEELEPPVPVTLPDHGDDTDVLEEEVMQDPLVGIPDSWIYIKDESYLPDYNPLEISSSSSVSSQSSSRWGSNEVQEIISCEESVLPMLSEDLLEDSPSINPKQQWIEEAKQKVELHIQEVRRHRKFRDETVGTESSVNKKKANGMIMVPSLVIVPRMQQVTDMPTLPKVPIPQIQKHGAIKPKATKKLQAPPVAPKISLKPRPRPAVTHGLEWEQWVLQEKARLEQHILEVRQSRKRRLQGPPVHTIGHAWHVIQTSPPPVAPQPASQDYNSRTNEMKSKRSVRQTEDKNKEKRTVRRKNKGKGKARKGRIPKRTSNIQELSETEIWT